MVSENPPACLAALHKKQKREEKNRREKSGEKKFKEGQKVEMESSEMWQKATKATCYYLPILFFFCFLGQAALLRQVGQNRLGTANKVVQVQS